MLLNMLARLALLAHGAAALNTLKVSGSNFVDSQTNERFDIIGVAYQPGGSAGFMPQNGVDPLSNATTCLRDAILMQSLGVNCIRVYNLDPAVSHDDCAAIFNAAGIYMIIDVNSPLPNQSINAGEPWTSYDATYLKHIFQVVEAFKGYSNLLGFFSGNEIVNDMNSGNLDPPYIRAVTRDLKNYIAKHGGRAIPVGYSAADVREILFDTWEYLQCSSGDGSDDPSRIDFFGLNSYSWCGPTATYQTSGYDDMVTGFANTTVPVFFSEYGCNKVQPRTFTEVGTIYGSQMSAVMSGGLVYEWTQEDNDFGLVTLNANGTVSLLSDYTALQGQLNKIDIKAVTSSNDTATALTPPACKAGLISDSGFSTNFTIPAVPPGAQALIDGGVTGAHASASADVSATKMPCTVYGSDGAPVTGLTLKIVSDSNTPSGTTLGGNGTSTTDSSASASSSSAAAARRGQGYGPGGVLAAGLLGLFFL